MTTWRGETGWKRAERLDRVGIHVQLWLVCIVWQKPTHYKSYKTKHKISKLRLWWHDPMYVLQLYTSHGELHAM